MYFILPVLTLGRTAKVNCFKLSLLTQYEKSDGLEWATAWRVNHLLAGRVQPLQQPNSIDATCGASPLKGGCFFFAAPPRAPPSPPPSPKIKA